MMGTLVIGLGNPGGEYRGTRHNAGWMCLDELERRGRFGREHREGPAKVKAGTVEGLDLILARPQTYMNLSGKAGNHLTQKYNIASTDVIVVHDEMDLPLGRLHLKQGGGSAGQKGVASLADSWRTKDFVRVRIGVGRPAPGVDPTDHVLTRFAPGEREVFVAAVNTAADAILGIIRDGLDAARVHFNRRDSVPLPAAPDAQTSR